MSLSTLQGFLIAWSILAVIVSGVLLRVRAPYGRHRSDGWGPTLDHRLGWFLMEFPALTVFAGLVLAGDNAITAPVIVFIAAWQIHYFNRSILFPIRMSSVGRRMPIVIVASAVVFNVVNGWLNGYYVGWVEAYGRDWLADPRFMVGAVVFALGMTINVRSDNILLRLRRESGGRYVVPHAGLFRFVSCPNYLGEIVEWFGFAIMTWSPAAAAFALWTVANLVPRALAHHRWYRERFEDYPEDRRAVLPFMV